MKFNVKMLRVTLQAIQLLLQSLGATIILGFLSVVALMGMLIFPLQDLIRKLKKKERKYTHTSPYSID
jgi:hypothetical protein